METKATKLSPPFAGQKILVTGASGFIGSHLCRRLCRDGAEVHGISRAKRADDEHGLRWWQGELAESTTVRQLLAAIKPDLIFHLASHVAGAQGLDLVLPTFCSNLMSTVNLLTVAGEIGCHRIILTGSLEEPEEAEGIPCSPYTAAKWAGSIYARMFHALYRLPVVILRVFMVYGPAQPDPRKLIPYIILSLLRGQVPKLTSGLRSIDWIYVEDVVEGILAAAQATRVEGCTIDVGSGQLATIRTVVEHLVQLTGAQSEPLFGALADRPLERVRMADTVRSYAMLGWKPTISLEEGLKRTVDWYARHLRDGTV